MEALVLLSKAMADENRLKIVALIQREKQLCVCELSDTLQLSQPLVSRHLKQLKAAQVLESHKEGKWTIYAIAKERSPLIEAYLSVLSDYEAKLPEIYTCKVR